MRVKTHQYIAETAIKLVEDITEISFNHKLVKIGSCAPDIALNRRLKLHSPALAGLEFDRILNKFGSGKRSNAFLSYMFGVYSHYVADAFCYAHNNYVVDLKSHVQYEVSMQDMLEDIELPSNIMDLIIEKSEFLKHKTALEYMQTENDQYLKMMEDKTDWDEMARIDISFAIMHSTVLMVQLIYEMQEQQVLAFAI